MCGCGYFLTPTLIINELMEENGFELVTKGHRLCAKRHHTRSSRDVLINNDDQVGLNEDTICERIRQRK